MSVQLCNTNHPVNITWEALNELDIFRVCRNLFQERTAAIEDQDKETEAFLKTYLTSDATEISRRSEIIGYLRENPDSQRLIAQLTAEYRRLSSCLSLLNRLKHPLKICTCMRQALEAYTASVRLAESLFVSGSPLIDGIAAVIKHEKESSCYRDVQECLRQLGSIIQPLKRITLAVNISESGEAMQISITDINRGADKLSGLFGSQKGNVNSLCDAAPVRERGHLAHLEKYIITQVEKQWAAPLKAALRKLRKIDRDQLWVWKEWLEPIELYQKGLLLTDMLANAGLDDCRPQPCADAMEAEGMLYPHMVLAERATVPQAFRFSLGDTIIITGANSSGKSSILKAFAQNCILAQLGFWIPAKSMRFIPYKQYDTVFAAGEDRQISVSRYQLEAEKMHKAIRLADQDTLLLFNEPFTSTNPVEAAELLCDIITQLHQARATVMMVTHIFDVYNLLRMKGIKVRSYTMGSKVDGDKIVHSYAVEEKEPDGLSYARLLAIEYGFHIASLVDDPDKVAILENFMMWGGSDRA